MQVLIIKMVLLDTIRHDDLLAMSIYITHQSEFTLKALGCEQLLNESGQESLYYIKCNINTV